MAQKFCPKCGTKRQGNEAFCQHCGYQFEEAKQSANDNVVAEKSTRSASSPRQPLSRGKKIGLWSIGIIVVLFIGFFMWGNSYYSATKQVDRMAQVLSDPKKDASELVTTADPNLKVTAKNVEPLQKYFADNKDELDTLMRKLRNGASFRGLSLKQEGHYLIFFKKYKLDVAPAYATVETNHADSTIYVDDKKVGTATGSDGSYTKNVGPYFPGEHTFQVKSVVNGRHLQTDKDRSNLWGKDNVEEMAIDTATFTVSGIPGATVLFNGKDMGKLNDDGKLEFKDYPITQGLEVQIQTRVKGKDIKSESLNVCDHVHDGEKTLEPQFEGVISQKDAQDLLSDAFNQFTATSDSGAELYKGQEDNSDYKDVQEMLKGFDKNDKNLSYTSDVTVKSVLPDGNGESDVVFDVKYEFVRDDDTKLVQVMEYSGCTIEKNPDYDKDDKGQPYVIDTIGTGKMIRKDTISNDD